MLEVVFLAWILCLFLLLVLVKVEVLLGMTAGNDRNALRSLGNAEVLDLVAQGLLDDLVEVISASDLSEL